MSADNNIIKQFQTFIAANPLDSQSKDSKESKELQAKYDSINTKIQEIKPQLEKIDVQNIKKPLLDRAQRILDIKESPIAKLERILHVCADILHTQTIKQQSEKTVSENLGKAVTEIGKKLTVDSLLSTISKYKLEKNELHLFIRAAAAKDPECVCQNLSKLNVEAPAFLEELAKDIGSHAPKVLLEHIGKFKLPPGVAMPLMQKAEEQCYKNAEAEVEKNPKMVFEAIAKHNITSDKDKLRLALQVAKKNPDLLIDEESKFHFKNEGDFKITNALIEANAFEKALKFMRTRISDPEQLSKIAKTLAQKNFDQLANNWKVFANSSNSISILKDLAKTHPSEVLKSFNKFAFDEKSDAIEVLKIIATDIPEEFLTNESLRDYDGSRFEYSDHLNFIKKIMNKKFNQQQDLLKSLDPKLFKSKNDYSDILQLAAIQNPQEVLNHVLNSPIFASSELSRGGDRTVANYLLGVIVETHPHLIQEFLKDRVDDPKFIALLHQAQQRMGSEAKDKSSQA